MSADLKTCLQCNKHDACWRISLSEIDCQYWWGTKLYTRMIPLYKRQECGGLCWIEVLKSEFYSYSLDTHKQLDSSSWSAPKDCRTLISPQATSIFPRSDIVCSEVTSFRFEDSRRERVVPPTGFPWGLKMNKSFLLEILGQEVKDACYRFWSYCRNHSSHLQDRSPENLTILRESEKFSSLYLIEKRVSKPSCFFDSREVVFG